MLSIRMEDLIASQNEQASGFKHGTMSQPVLECSQHCVCIAHLYVSDGLLAGLGTRAVPQPG